jgi:formyltetrahydrofolate deformylase
LAANGGNIVDSQQYDDPESDRFFMRVLFLVEPGGFGRNAIARRFEGIAPANQMFWILRLPAARRKVMTLVSKFDHWLADRVLINGNRTSVFRD